MNVLIFIQQTVTTVTLTGPRRKYVLSNNVSSVLAIVALCRPMNDDSSLTLLRFTPTRKITKKPTTATMPNIKFYCNATNASFAVIVNEGLIATQCRCSWVQWVFSGRQRRCRVATSLLCTQRQGGWYTNTTTLPPRNMFTSHVCSAEVGATAMQRKEKSRVSTSVW